ncbi:hypothetical protein ACJIZ3_004329 [Penstemon smallii]|uniref:Glutamate receptor n=1 Tax=Penstemon smallii TaxID=265156 RepID=A0ABD3S1Q1_9LAMI
MEKKFCILHFFCFVLYLNILITTLMAQRMPTTIPIRVGVVLDMDNQVVQMGLNCISIALSDFYAKHDHYGTRLALNNRDSKGTAVGAATAAVDLLKNVEVQAIIGPMFSSQANFLIDLGDEAQVPIITFTATSPSLSSSRSPYFVRATLNDSSQVKAIGSIIQAFGWREVVPIYVDNEFGKGIIPYLNDAMEEVNARVPYRSVIPSLATDDQIIAELYKLMSMQTRVFIVHMLRPLGSRLFTKAKELGMMSENYAWIITDGIANAFDAIDPSVRESMLGVIGVIPYVPKTTEVDNFKIRYRKRATGPTLDVNTFGLWAYDSATALAMAVEEARLTNARFSKTNITRNSTDIEAIGVSTDGPKIIQALLSTRFKGLAGDFQLVDGQLQSPPYQIVNVIGPAARGVGYWTKENGIVKELNFTNANTNTNTYSALKSNLGSIIWPGDRTSPPKGWVIPTNGRKLRIGVPFKDGFTEFVRVTWNPDNSTKVQGYCIDVFDAVMATLPYGVQYEYIPFSNSEHKSAGSYNDLADQSMLTSLYLIQSLVFPWLHQSNIIRARVHGFFLKPLTWQLWVTSLCSFVFIGILIWILEHRINGDFKGTNWHQVGLVLWFAFSTLVFAHKEKLVSNLSKLVLIFWFFVVLVLTQSYTASLTSMLTLQQLQPTVTDINTLLKNNEYVGYQQGSFVFGMLKRMNFDESRLLQYNSIEEMNELFSKGSKKGGIAAAFDEIPYIKLFLGKYCSKYTMVDPTYKTDGFGFVFPIGSPLVTDTSRAILNVTQGEEMVRIERKWFGDKTECSDLSDSLSSNSLGLESFWMLFVIVGTAAVIALITYLGRFLHQNWDVIQGAESVGDMFARLLERFQSEDPNAPDFMNNIVDGNEAEILGDIEPPPDENVPREEVHHEIELANQNQNLPPG